MNRQRPTIALIGLLAAMTLASGCQSRDADVKSAPPPQTTAQSIQDDIRNNPHMSAEQKASALRQMSQAQTMKPEGAPAGHP